MKQRKRISAKELDRKFDAGKEDILQHFDVEKAITRIALDLPLWMLKALDAEAERLGNSRQSVIRGWIAQRIDSMQPSGKKQAAG
jgi:hypothetical protein